jgi:hypothetical protein
VNGFAPFAIITTDANKLVAESTIECHFLGYQLKPHERGDLKRQSFPTWHNCNGQRNSTERALR